MYRTPPPANLLELEQRIRAEVQALRRTRKVRQAVAHMLVRAERFMRLNGAQVEGRAGQ